MDLLVTLVFIYLAYRGYRWYSNLQQQVESGTEEPFRVERNPPSNHEDEYIDYEEIE